MKKKFLKERGIYGSLLLLLYSWRESGMFFSFFIIKKEKNLFQLIVYNF